MEQKFEFKKLELNNERNIWQRLFKSHHGKKTAIYMIIGSVGSLIFHYFTNDGTTFSTGDIMKSIALGAFIGFFITNSPCARGRC